MILPIVAYGDNVLKQHCQEIDESYPHLNLLIANMFETMYNSNGVGLAAPQIGKAIRLFVVDTLPFSEDEDLKEEKKNQLKNFKKVFINAQILEETGEEWTFSEGCLSIPGVHEDVKRKSNVLIKYQDEKFVWHTETFSGLAARVIQHEYDHIQGILFIDRISNLKKRLLQGRLTNISKGKIKNNYPMRFADDKKR